MFKTIRRNFRRIVDRVRNVLSPMYGRVEDWDPHSESSSDDSIGSALTMQPRRRHVWSERIASPLLDTEVGPPEHPGGLGSFLNYTFGGRPNTPQPVETEFELVDLYPDVDPVGGEAVSTQDVVPPGLGQQQAPATVPLAGVQELDGVEGEPAMTPWPDELVSDNVDPEWSNALDSFWENNEGDLLGVDDAGAEGFGDGQPADSAILGDAEDDEMLARLHRLRAHAEEIPATEPMEPEAASIPTPASASGGGRDAPSTAENCAPTDPPQGGREPRVPSPAKMTRRYRSDRYAETGIRITLPDPAEQLLYAAENDEAAPVLARFTVESIRHLEAFPAYVRLWKKLVGDDERPTRRVPEPARGEPAPAHRPEESGRGFIGPLPRPVALISKPLGVVQVPCLDLRGVASTEQWLRHTLTRPDKREIAPFEPTDGGGVVPPRRPPGGSNDSPWPTSSYGVRTGGPPISALIDESKESYRLCARDSLYSVYESDIIRTRVGRLLQTDNPDLVLHYRQITSTGILDIDRGFVCDELLHHLQAHMCLRPRTVENLDAMRSRAIRWCKEHSVPDRYARRFIPTAVCLSFVMTKDEAIGLSLLDQSGTAMAQQALKRLRAGEPWADQLAGTCFNWHYWFPPRVSLGKT